MSLQTKPSLIIIGTLILGIVLGVVGSSALMRDRFQRLHDMGKPHRMSGYIIDTIGPLDPATEDTIRTILDATGKRMHEEMRAGRDQIRSIIDSTLLQIEPLLTEEQFKRAKEIIGRGPGPHDRKGPHRRLGVRRPGMNRD